MSKAKKGSGRGARDLTVKVKTAKGRKLSSTRWLQRQLNDPFVAASKRDGYRSRAAYKLTEIDDKYHILKPGHRVVDLGCAPGSWVQIASKRIKLEQGQGHVIGIDLLEVEPIAGADLLVGDFMDDDAPEKLIALLGGHKADVVMSDMAASATGHKQTDPFAHYGVV